MSDSSHHERPAMKLTQTETETETDYRNFITDLTALTRKYGVAIQSVGGVFLAEQEDEFDKVTYTADISSGDLYPEFPGH